MAKKSFIGKAPTGVPNHIIKVNNKSVGIDEDFVGIKTYGADVFINNRHVYTATSMAITLVVPKGVVISSAKATHGSWLEVLRS